MFPNGKVVKTFEGDVYILDVLGELSKKNFTGVVKFVNGSRGNFLLIDGLVKAAVFDDFVGNNAVDEAISIRRGKIEVHKIDKKKAKFVLQWYKEIHGFGEVTWPPKIDREKILKKVGLKDPDPEHLKLILEREGIMYLIKKKKG